MSRSIKYWVAGLFLCFGVPAAYPDSPALKVSGNQILTASSACTVILRGVNVDSLEFMATGQGPSPGGVTATVGESITQWGSNLIRVPLSQDFWFGVPNSKSTSVNQTAYRTLVDNIVQICSDNNAYALLDLHWSGTSVTATAPGGTGWGTAIAQQNMPDDNSVTFWSSVAARYANNPAVLFDLYNEPHTVSWAIWQGGGDGGNGFYTPGMQNLLNAIRATGAHNPVVVGGLDWAYDLTGVNSYPMSDSNGSGLIYASHVYPWKGSAPWVPADGDNKVTVAASAHPILIGEFGQNQSDSGSCSNCQESGYTGYSTGAWDKSVLNWINLHHYHYTAWDMNTSSSPDLIANWQFTPTIWDGLPVQKDLATPVVGLGCVAGFSPTLTPTPTSTTTSTPTVTGTIPTDTFTVTSTVTNTPTITNTPISTTCVTEFNGCETLGENGTWWGNNALQTIIGSSTAPVGAITQGSHCLQVNIQTGVGWNNSVANLGGSAPNVWNAVTQFQMDVYADPTLIANSGAWHQLFLLADVGSAGQTVISAPSYYSLNGGANHLTFNINTALSGQPSGSHVTTLYFVYNSQNGATGNLYFDNLQMVAGCQFTATPTPTWTGTSTSTPTASSTASWTATPTGTWYTATSTDTPTVTATPTDTDTQTETPTGTWYTATNTATFTPTVTLTPTVTATGTTTWTETPGVTHIVNDVIYPNPVTFGGSFNVAVGDASDLHLAVYSIAYRKVMEQTIPSQSLALSNDLEGRLYFASPPIDLTDSKGAPLANGLYYVTVETTAGKKTLRLLLLR